MLIDQKLFTKKRAKSNGKKMYIETYGCQMNFSDSEIVASILSEDNYISTKNIEEADIILVNTCSIREKAEETVRKRLKFYNSVKKRNKNIMVGVMGCMAERLKTKLLEEEKLVDIVVGPDAYRDLPKLIKKVEDGRKAINVILSKEETYGNISPVRFLSNGVTAFVSITRGCDNMCSFCVVPFTRGRERSRNPNSIVVECKELIRNNFKEVTLLGQNVDSYLWYGGGLKKDFNKANDKEKADSINFAKLLRIVAEECPELRIRFSTSNPQDMTEEVIKTMKSYANICNYIHLPVQSGSNKILKLMNRGYTREEYINLIDIIKKHIPDCGLSMDMISGFCHETDSDHLMTLSLMDYVKYDYGYMFKYSDRPNTQAHRKLEDNVEDETKAIRLSEIISKQRQHSLENNKRKIGSKFEVLIEGISKKSENDFFGRNMQNNVIIFPKEKSKIGDTVTVMVEKCTSATLIGKII
tara:strand:- start:385 stop:1794 length:1410 start_codon:yes stop_codon:yes gene_type:complete